MKHIIEFNLPEEKEELEMYQKASDMHCVLWDMSQYLRQLYKYESERVGKMTADALLEEIRTTFYSYLSDRNVDI